MVGEGDDTVTYYVADVVLSDATTLRSAFANGQFGENIIAMYFDGEVVNQPSNGGERGTSDILYVAW